MTHTILTLVLAKSISDDNFVAAALQRLGDIFLMTDKGFLSASTCYQANMDIIKYSGLRRHVADCVLRFGIVLLLEDRRAEAKRKLMNCRRIYELAEDSQGYSYCEAVLAECEVEGPKVSLTATSLPTDLELLDILFILASWESSPTPYRNFSRVVLTVLSSMLMMRVLIYEWNFFYRCH